MRPSRDKTWLEVAQVVARRSTCLRRAVGCILIDVYGHVLSTGYNGVAPGRPHCNEAVVMLHTTAPFERITHPNACAGATSAPGTGLDLCEAIHAESNALLQCRNVLEIDTCFVTHSPCVHCAKLLCVTSCRRVVFIEDYAHGNTARDIFLGSDPFKEWAHRPLNEA